MILLHFWKLRKQLQQALVRCDFFTLMPLRYSQRLAHTFAVGKMNVSEPARVCGLRRPTVY